MINWYKKCGEVIQKKTGMKINECYDLLNQIMQELDDYGFVDADWYSEIEPDDPRYK